MPPAPNPGSRDGENLPVQSGTGRNPSMSVGPERAAPLVLSALVNLAANVREIRTFVQELRAEADGKLRRLPRRRRTAPLGTWLPATSIATGTEGADSGRDHPRRT